MLWSAFTTLIWVIGITTIYGWVMPAFMGGGGKK
jgi:hypothetical protein